MSSGKLDFSFDMSGVDRLALIEEAAKAVDEKQGHLSGQGGRRTRRTKEGNALRKLAVDKLSLAPSLDVYRVTDRKFLEKNRSMPARLAELTRLSDFYWIKFPIGVMAPRGWRFHCLEFKVEFNPDTDAELRPKAWQILPDRKFQTQFKMGDRLKVTIDENIKFKAEASAIGARTGAAVSARAGLAAEFGPFEYQVVSPKIDHSGTGLDWVFWRLEGAEFFEKNRPEFVVITQVPKAAAQLKIEANILAYRYLNFFGASLKDVMAEFSAGLAAFLQGGVPVSDHKSYDVTNALVP